MKFIQDIIISFSKGEGNSSPNVSDDVNMMISNHKSNFSNSDSNDTKISSDGSNNMSDKGPIFGVLNRLDLGLAIRNAGILYPQAISFALVQLLLEVFEKEYIRLLTLKMSSNSFIVSSESDEDFINNKYSILIDLFIKISELKKLGNVIDIYHRRNESEAKDTCIENIIGYNSIITSELIEGWHQSFGMTLGSGDKMDVIRPNLETLTSISTTVPSSDFSLQLATILEAANTLVMSIEQLHLTNIHQQPPLLAGDAIKNVLKNIPKGTMFGEVSVLVEIFSFTDLISSSCVEIYCS